MQRRNTTKALICQLRKIAHADGADLACSNNMCIASAVSSIMISGSEPMHLVDVDIVGSQPRSPRPPAGSTGAARVA